MEWHDRVHAFHLHIKTGSGGQVQRLFQLSSGDDSALNDNSGHRVGMNGWIQAKAGRIDDRQIVGVGRERGC